MLLSLKMYVCVTYMWIPSGSGLTWKIAYMMHVRGRLWEYSDTVKIFSPHLFRSSNSYRWKMQTDAGENSENQTTPLNQLSPGRQIWQLISGSTLDSRSSLSVLTPKREMPQLRLGPWDTFFTPLIWVISCCFFFFSRAFGVGGGISTSFCLSVGNIQNKQCFFISKSLHLQQNWVQSYYFKDMFFFQQQ